MKKYAIAKIFLGNGDDIIVHGEMEKVNKYLNDMYESKCLLDDNIEFDKEEYCDKCEYCESLRGNGEMEECSVLVTSHEEDLTEKECEEALEDYKDDLNWAEVVNLI